MTSNTRSLVDGFQRFREKHYESNDSLYQQLVKEGQTPKTLIVACCDSRVDPALVLDCEPGDLFVIRNVANLVPPVEGRAGHHGTTAAIEYGVRILGVEHIIVLGHAHCGGITTLVKTGGASVAGSFIDDWMCLAEEVRSSVVSEMPNATLEEQIRECEQRAILVSLDNLMTFSWIKDKVDAGRLTLHGWYFDIAHGQLLSFNKQSKFYEEM
jgi:carbonic anhydrase